MPRSVNPSLGSATPASDVNQFLLMVDWVSISAHKKGFRQSSDYPEWKALLHHFYDPFPVVE